MNIIKKKIWQLPEREITDEKKYLTRRNFSKSLFFSYLFSKSLIKPLNADESRMNNKDYDYQLNYIFNNNKDRNITPYKIVTRYNNFYEFGTSKQIWKAAKKLKSRPWKVELMGEINKPTIFDIDDLIRKFNLEERVYRFRCVEAWSMVVPWLGFSLSELVKLAEPNNNVKYIAFETFFNPDVAKGQKQNWYPWPYLECITIEEALNELAFLAIGIYGKNLPNQNGAPIRLVLPWKYGFKSIKSIAKIKFLKERPKTFWENIAPNEYGFWANVNPNFPHPRWSQTMEKDIGTGLKIPTKIFNGYEKWVQHIYKNKNDRKYFL